MEKTTGVNDEKEEKKEYSFYEIARRIALAGIGAIAISHDEMEEFIDKLVERGEIARKDGEKLLKEIRERHKKYHSSEEPYVQKRMEEFFSRMNIPVKKDFDDLTEKISDLEKKIDNLTKTKKGNQ